MSDPSSGDSRYHRGKRALVTGGAGFIGSHLVEELVRRGAEVTVVDDLSSGRSSNLDSVADRTGIEVVDLLEADLGELLSSSGPDLVFHLAGSVDVPASIQDPDRDLRLNGIATFRLLEAMRQVSSSSRLVFASSAAVYGEARARALSEEDPTVPVAPYGVSKLMAERYLAVHASLYGIRAASLRLFPVFGPRSRRHVVHDLIAKVLDDPNELVIQGNGGQVRDFLHVSDVVEAFCLVSERAPLAGEVFNVARGDPLSIVELARLICERMGETPRLRFTGQTRQGISRRWAADVSRLNKLGWRPRVSLAAGVDDTLEWFRTRASGGPAG